MRLDKKLSTLLIMVSIFTLIPGCMSDLNSNMYSNDVKEIKIGAILYRKDDAFISMLAKNLDNIVKEKESEIKDKIIFDIVDSKGSLSNQNNQVDKFISQKYDVICVNMVDRTAASMIIDKAKAANIPLVFFNREPVEEDMQRWNKLYYVGARADQSGEMQANIIINAWKNNMKNIDKNGDGKIQYVMLEGEPGHQDTYIRTEYCIKTITESGIELEKLADDTANWQADQASTKMAQWIKKFGDKIEVVFSNNDDMALGAIHALNSENIIKNRPIVVGIDGLPEVLEAIKNGDMEGTVINNSKEQAKSIFDIAYTLSIHGDINSVEGLEGKYIRTYHSEITKDNIDLYLKK